MADRMSPARALALAKKGLRMQYNRAGPLTDLQILARWHAQADVFVDGVWWDPVLRCGTSLGALMADVDGGQAVRPGDTAACAAVLDCPPWVCDVHDALFAAAPLERRGAMHVAFADALAKRERWWPSIAKQFCARAYQVLTNEAGVDSALAQSFVAAVGVRRFALVAEPRDESGRLMIYTLITGTGVGEFERLALADILYSAITSKPLPSDGADT